MAFLPGIFGPKPTQQQQPQNNQQPQNGNQQQAGGPQNTSQQPQNNNNNGSGGAAGMQDRPANTQMNTDNPLDPFMKLLTPSKEVLDAQNARQAETSKGLFGDSFSSEAVTKAMSGMDFTQGINPELAQKALGGDQASLMELLNGVTRNAVSASVQMSHGMVEKGVSTGIERFGGDMDSRMRDFSLRNQNADNPALQHPFGKAMLSTIKKQIAAANPRMSADEVHQHAVSGFSEFAKMVTSSGESAQQAQNPGPKEMDWSLFLDGGDQNAAQH